MNRTRSIQLIGAAIAIAILLVVLSGPLGGSANSSAGQATVTRLPRPHPQSRISVTSTPMEPDSSTRSPRPHPKSRLH
jgi:hypothetical protein